METYIPIIYHLKEIVRHYKETGSVSKKALAACNKAGTRTKTVVRKTKKATSHDDCRDSKKPFKPTICCGIKFHYYSELKRHEQTFKHLHRIDPIKYKKCKKGFQPIKCCGCVFSAPAHWKTHINTIKHRRKQASGTLEVDGDMHQQEVIQREQICLSCPVCDLTFKKWTLLHSHVRLKHEDYPRLQCILCPSRHKTRKSLGYHLFKMHHVSQDAIDPIKCCGITFNYQSHVDRHRQSLKHLNKFRCSLGDCSELFDSEEEWKNHKATVHFFVNGKFQCPICNKYYATWPILQIHLKRVHSKSSVFECNECAVTFASKDSLKRHFVCSHLEPRVFPCDTCGLKFKRKDALTAHNKNIHERGRLFCTVCRIVFKTTEDLHKHMLMHRPCQVCGISFKSLREREVHSRTHLRGTKEEKKKIPSKKKDRTHYVKKERGNSSFTKENNENIKPLEEVQKGRNYSNAHLVINEQNKGEHISCTKYESLEELEDRSGYSVSCLETHEQMETEVSFVTEEEHKNNVILPENCGENGHLNMHVEIREQKGNDNSLCSDDNKDSLVMKMQYLNGCCDTSLGMCERNDSECRQSLKEMRIYLNL